MVEGSVNSAVVVACIDQFVETLKRPTVLILDNAPTHTSGEFNENIERWKQRGLTIQPGVTRRPRPKPASIGGYSPKGVDSSLTRIKFELNCTLKEPTPND